MTTTEIIHYVCDICGLDSVNEEEIKRCENRGYGETYAPGLLFQSESDDGMITTYCAITSWENRHNSINFFAVFDEDSSYEPKEFVTFLGGVSVIERIIDKDADSFIYACNFLRRWDLTPSIALLRDNGSLEQISFENANTSNHNNE